MADPVVPTAIGLNSVCDYQYYIDTTPTATPTWAPLGAGIDEPKPSYKDKSETNYFLSDGGFARSEVFGTEAQISVSGKRVRGDAAQDYVYSEPVKHAFGKARHSHLKIVNPTGDTLIWECTLTNIVDGSGKVPESEAISFDIMLNGKPAYTPHVAA